MYKAELPFKVARQDYLPRTQGRTTFQGHKAGLPSKVTRQDYLPRSQGRTI